VAIVYTAPAGAPPTTGTITGTITNATTGTPIAGAVVKLNPSGQTTTSGANGGYTLSNVAAGSYTLTATVGVRCGPSGSTPVTVTANGTSTANLALTEVRDGFGYTCADGPRPFVSATTVVPLTGDDAIATVPLPFPVKLYGQTYSTTAWVDTNGKVSLVNPGSFNENNVAIPAAAPPNATVYVFWDDLIVDASASVRTTVVGTAPNRGFVIEYRNVTMFNAPTRRLTFEIVLYENGEIAVAYQSLDDSLERGSSATVGIENAAGTVAYQYSFNQSVLLSGNGVLFRPPA
jgi:hypothetical protein